MAARRTPHLTLLFIHGTSSLAPHILLHELGIPFEIEAVRKTREGLARWASFNPQMRVPVLVMDGEVITEAPAVMTALAQLDPSRSLLGKTNLETVRVYEWMNWLSGTLHTQAWGTILWPERFIEDPRIHDAVVELGLHTAKEIYQAIETKLTGPYAVGDGLTIVDPYLYVFYFWGFSKELVKATTHPKYTRLMIEMAARDSVAMALEVEATT